MTDAVAAKLVALIAATFPTPGWETETLQVYRDHLVDLDEAVASAVVKDWLNTHDERPTIAAIRREVAKRHAAANGQQILPPDEAWEFVRQCFGTVGQYRDFPDTYPLVKKAVDGMGWVEMCRSDNLDVLRGQFRMAYTALSERRVADAATGVGALLIDSLRHAPQSLLAPRGGTNATN